MSSIDLSRFNFSGGENSAPIEDLTRLPQEDQQRLVLAGIDVHDTKVSGAFMQLNHADVHCTTRQEGLDLMDIRAALKKFDGLPQYYWKLLDPNKDEITRMAYEHLNGGYFVRARKGVKISQPVQSCMFIKGNAAGQAVHNIVVVEEGAELNILGDCATSQHSNDAAHLGITEYYVEKGDPKDNADNIKDLDSQFHELLYTCCRSQAYKDVLLPMHRKMTKFRKASVSKKSRAQESLKEHFSIYEALKARDPKLAKERIITHTIDARDRIKDLPETD